VELDDRKYKILQAVIQNYLETGEPVGSRTISKYTDLNLSSATIRNEMADLEELGYIVQPHTSAGRIPSDKGYRLYVDHMMQEKADEINTKEREVNELKDFLTDKVDKVEELVQNVAKMLATNTNYAAMISAPQMNKKCVKFIQLTMVEPTKILAVIVLSGNMIRNRMIELSDEIDNETVLKLNLLLNTSLNGLTLDEISLNMISRLRNQAGEYTDVVNRVIDAIAEVISAEEDVKIYTSGATNIFKYPELSDSAKASELICTLEEKQVLNELINLSKDETDGKGTGIQVYIGDEAPINSMKDCSIVTATYELEDGMKGTVGVIGPKRMDYEKVVESLKTLKAELDSVYKKK
jgi:heat-inducible transcriptional repressor